MHTDYSMISFQKLNPALLLFLLLLLAMPPGSRAQVTAAPSVPDLPTWGAPASTQSLPPMLLPAGFADDMAVGGLLAPRAFEFAPDGRIFILERGSDVTQDINFASLRVFKNGSLLPTRALTLNICGDGERGLLGIAIDPSFASNGYLYLYYTRQSTSEAVCAYNTFVKNLPGPRNRVSRFTMVGDSIDPASEQVLIDNIATDSGIHNAGDLHFGADGYLYVTVGDSNIQPSPAQDLTSLNGKMLRILPTPGAAGGYTTAGNPHDTASAAWYCGTNPPGTSAGPCREVFASGLRNPFRFSIRPGTSTPYAGDVGGGAWEEIDEMASGGNYGYPFREGPCPNGVICSLPQPPSGYADPIYAYPHVVVYANFDSAVIGGPFYTGSSFPAGYQDNLFFADFVQGWVKRLVYNSATGQWSALSFGTDGRGIIGLKIGLDTDLYYLSFVSDTLRTSEIHRIHYQPGVNQAPTAQISATPSGGLLNTLFTFSAMGSVDPDANLPLTYHWDFGDGTTLSATSTLTVTKTYSTTGAKVVTLTVTDSGIPPATSQPVTVTVFPGDPPPTGTIAVSNVSAPGRGLYYAGDTWSFTAVNPNDNLPLPPNAFSWDVVFHHRTHTHPFLSNLQGSSGQFSIPTSGETDPVVWYRVTLHLTDSVGQVTDISQDIYPTIVPLLLQTNPAGGSLLLDGHAVQTPYATTRVVGILTSLEVPSPQRLGGINLPFTAWSNGGSRLQVLQTPPGGIDFIARLGYFTLFPAVLGSP
jgi:glucose/arabinose dehydrogenase